MNKSEKVISDFFKPAFKKHSSLESFWFLIYNFEDGIYLADEDCGINGLRWDELSDKQMYDSSYKIQEAINELKKSKCNVANTIQELQKLVFKLQKDADDSNPLNKIFEDVWNDEIRKELMKKVSKYLMKEISWKYVDWCQCDVKRDGNVKIIEFED